MKKNKAMRFVLILLIVVWICNVVNWVAPMDHLQHTVLSTTSLFLGLVCIATTIPNLVRVRRDLRRLETEIIVLETLTQFLARASKEVKADENEAAA